MAKTIETFMPHDYEVTTATYQSLNDNIPRRVLAFDGSVNESAIWASIAKVGITAPLTALVYVAMISAKAGTIDLDVEIEAITGGDAINLKTATSFDAVNSADANAVPATAGFLSVISVTLTNNDTIAAGDYYRLRVTRDAANDTAVGDMMLLAVELRDAE